MSAANSKIKFIILLISVILKLNFPCLVDEQPSEEEIKSLIQNLTVKSPLFDKSRERLARIGPPAVEYLIRALKDENWQIRTNAAFILGKIGDKRAVKHLIQSLTDKNQEVRYAAACALGDIKDKKALEPLIETLKDKHWEVRRDAVWALYKLKDKKASDPLVETLTDTRWEVRQDTAFVLSKLGDQKAVKPLIQTLQDKKWQVREQAAFTLGMIGDKRAAIPLIRDLQDKAIKVRKSAANGLGELRDKRAVEPIIQVLKDVSSSVRLYAVRALGQIGDKKAVEPLSHTLLSDENEDIRQNAARVLGSIGDKRAADPLYHALKDSNKQVRIWAALSLGKIHDKRAIEPLIEVVREGEWDVRLYALLALGEIGDESSVEPLLQLYSIWAPESRNHFNLVKSTLGKICQADIKPLIQLLKHEKRQIREASAVILGEIESYDESSLEFHSLECAGEVIIPHIPKKKDYENIEAICKINYIYRGKKIAGGYLSETWKQSYSIYRQYFIYARISYLDKKGKLKLILNKPEQERIIRIDWVSGNLMDTAYMENEIYTAELYFLSSSRANEKKIYRLLKKKKIDEIQIEVNKVIVDWQFRYLEEKENLELFEKIKKGKFEFKVGKKISIKVKYENKKDLMSR
jgi:HEAT repeat protein